MPIKFGKIGSVLVVALLLSACAGSNPRLLKTGPGDGGPDEFGVLPAKPLQTPANFTDLPAPTPEGSNITDPSPNADAIVALGGNPAVLTRAGIPVADGALLAQVQRFGVAPDVREQLAAADLALRRRSRGIFFLRGFGGNRYFAAYRRQSLDQFREFERLRAAGVKTPTAPPRTVR